MDITSELNRLKYENSLLKKKLSRQQHDEFIENIKTAVQHAKTKYPQYPIDFNKQMSILAEEVGEVAKAILDYQDEGARFEDIGKELFQVGAMVLRMLENLEFTRKIYEQK